MSAEHHDPDGMELARAKMLRCAFDHWIGADGGDVRIGVLLQRAGMLKKPPDYPQVPENVITAIRDRGAEPSSNVGNSPVVFVRSSDDDANREAIAVLEHLSLPHRNARDAALTHFERELNSRSPYLSPLSQHLLTEYADDVRSDSIDRWLRAAMRLESEFDSDFKLNLAGFRTGIQIGNCEVQQHHWSRLCKPSVASILSIDDDGWCLIKPKDSRARAIEEVVNASKSLSQLLCEHDRLLGHLPLHASLDVGTVACQWLKRRENSGTWADLNRWAQSSPHPVRKVQACLVAIANPSLIPPEECETFWRTIVALSTPESAGDQERLDAEILEFEADLARFYFAILRCARMQWM